MVNWFPDLPAYPLHPSLHIRSKYGIAIPGLIKRRAYIPRALLATQHIICTLSYRPGHIWNHIIRFYILTYILHSWLTVLSCLVPHFPLFHHYIPTHSPFATCFVIYDTVSRFNKHILLKICLRSHFITYTSLI